jgi:hypothetical protein
MKADAVRQSVEELAQALYEARDLSGISWVKRGPAVRNAWLRIAQKRLAESDNPSERRDSATR